MSIKNIYPILGIIDKVKNRFTMDYASTEEMILYLILSSTVMIDFINGIWIDKVPNLGFSIGQFIRIAILGYFFVCLYKYDRSKIKKILMIIIFFMINIFSSFFIHKSMPGIKVDISLFLKILFFITLSLTIMALYNNNKLKDRVIKESILNNLYVLPFLMLLSYILGVGKASYSYGNIGWKGTFYSLNGINITMIVLFVFAVDNTLNRRKKFIPFLFAASTLVMLMLLGTKSSYIFIIYILAMYLFVMIKKGKLNFSTIKLIYLFTIVIAFISIFFNKYFEGILLRQIYNLRMSKNNIFTYLLSNRNYFLSLQFNNFYNDSSFLRIIMGTGYYMEQRELALSLFKAVKYKGVLKSIEMDIFDIFFSYGIVGIIITYGFVIGKIMTFAKRSKDLISNPYMISLICLLIFSVLGGHVFVEAISSTFIGICLGGLYIEYMKKVSS